jgi:RNA polymerase sigma-54 factor
MAPRMIQSMEILQLPLMALQERIDQELAENPVLVDLREAAPPESEAESGPEEAPAEAPAPAEFDGTPDGDAEASGDVGPEDDWSESFSEGPRMSRAALSEEADRKHDAMQNMASRPRSLHDDLADQLSFLDAPPSVRALAEYIIFNLDENGYFHHDLSVVVREFGGDVTQA